MRIVSYDRSLRTAIDMLFPKPNLSATAAAKRQPFAVWGKTDGPSLDSGWRHSLANSGDCSPVRIEREKPSPYEAGLGRKGQILPIT